MRTIFLLLLLFLLASCQKEVFQGNIEEKIINCEIFENYTVPVKPGYTTYVTYGNDTLAAANEEITIKIPKGALVPTRSGESIKVDFSLMKDSSTYSQFWQAIMFEDTESGDYDYNDLVIHVCNERQDPWQKDYSTQTISIQPIALGSYSKIKLGFILADQSEHIVSDNVRRDLFSNKQGFINTESAKAPVRYKLKKWLTDYKIARKADPKIAWFIEVDGKRYYAVTSDLDYQNYAMFNSNAMPYGILAYSTFNYPEEKTSVFQVYKGFSAWLNKGASNIGSSDYSFCYQYCRGGIISEDGTNHKIWDYLDLGRE